MNRAAGIVFQFVLFSAGGASPRVLAATLPIGAHDSSGCDSLSGWACDADDFSKPLDVHFYAGGPAGNGSFVGTAKADLQREAAVGQLCGGKARHGFSFPTPASLKDGRSHAIYAYAINVGPAGGNPLLPGSPKAFACVPPAPLGPRGWGTAGGSSEKVTAFCPFGDGAVYGKTWSSLCGGAIDGSKWTQVQRMTPDSPPIARFSSVRQAGPGPVPAGQSWKLAAIPAYTGYVDAFVVSSPQGSNQYLPGWAAMSNGILIAPAASAAGTYTAKFRPAMDDADWSDPLSVTVSKPAPPSLTLLTPAPGAEVAGVVAMTAEPRAAAGVAKVECLVDGALIGSASTAPYNCNWNSRGASNGAHALSMKVIDSSGQSAQRQVLVTLANPASASPGGDLPLFVFAGQSNAVGFSRIEELPDRRARPGVLYYYTTRVTNQNPAWAPTLPYPVAAPYWSEFYPNYEGYLNFYNANNLMSVGPESGAGTEISASKGLVGMVKYAVSGTNLHSDWNPARTDSLFQNLKDRVAAAKADLKSQYGAQGRIAGFFWMQGESDADDVHGAAYEANLTRFISRVRSDFNEPDLPFIIGRITDSKLWPRGDLVRAAQERVAAAVPNVAIVGTDDLPRRWSAGDDAHFDSRGSYTLGQRFAQAFLAMPRTPAGNFDSADCSSVIGWTCDANDYSRALDVHFYVDGAFGWAAKADARREAAVGAVCGGYSNRGFSSPLPASLKDGKTHSIAAYAINIGPTGGNPQIGTVKTVSCAPADTTPPSLSITAPAAGAVISGRTSVAVSASDDVGVAKVELHIDGMLKFTDTAAPFSFSIDASQLSVGTHTLLAKAYDAAGNSAQASVAVKSVRPSPLGGRKWTTVSGLDGGKPNKLNAYCPSGDGSAYGGAWVSLCGGASDGSKWSPVLSLPPDNPPITRFSSVQRTPSSIRLGEGWLLEAVPAYTGFVDAFVVSSPDGSDLYLPGWAYMVDGRLQAPPGSREGVYTAKFRPAMDDADWSDQISVTVSGSTGPIDTVNYFPLVPGNWWDFSGKIMETGAPFRLKLKVGPVESYCNQPVTPVLFFKDNDQGYWGAGTSWNLRWMLIDYMKAGNWPQEYQWGTGEKHYVRDPGNFESLGQYTHSSVITSEDASRIPPYVIFPRSLTLGNFTGAKQLYYGTTTDGSSCDWIQTSTPAGRCAWFLNYTLTTVRTPAYQGPAVRIHFVEGEPAGPGTYVEDWYFAKGKGIVKIEALKKGEEWTIPHDSLPIARQMSLKGLAVTLRDSTPPSVSVTEPSNGASVAGSVTARASASDDRGVAKVEFYLDGTLKSTDTAAPFSFSFDSARLANGSHSIAARAYDAAGNSAQAAISVTAANPASPPGPPSGLAAVSIGFSSAVVSWMPPEDPDLAGYLLDLAEDASFTRWTWYRGYSLGKVSRKTLSGLSPSTTYFLRLRNRDASGNVSDPCPAISFRTASQPQDLFLVRVSSPGSNQTVSSPQTGVRLTVAPGALSIPVTLSIRVVRRSKPSAAWAEDETVYEIEPSDLVLDEPSVLSIPASGPERSLHRLDGTWEALPGTWNPAERTVSASITQLGSFAALPLAQGSSGPLEIAEGYFYPNPCKGRRSPTARARAQGAERVEARIFNLAGEKIDEFAMDPASPPGVFEKAWDGASKAASGVYLFVLRAFSGAQASKPFKGRFALVK